MCPIENFRKLNRNLNIAGATPLKTWHDFKFVQNTIMAENLKIPGFSEFYIPIKAHFNENSQDFNDLNVLSSVKEKLLYLLQHDVIVNMCKSKFSITRDGKNVRRTRDDGEKETKQYPQMTKKAKVVVSQSVGRKLIATETIEPGSYET